MNSGNHFIPIRIQRDNVASASPAIVARENVALLNAGLYHTVFEYHALLAGSRRHQVIGFSDARYHP
jgi:hypothetical protein